MMYKDTITLNRYFTPVHSKKAESNIRYWKAKLERKEDVRILNMLWRVTSVQDDTTEKSTSVIVCLDYIRSG